MKIGLNVWALFFSLVGFLFFTLLFFFYKEKKSLFFGFSSLKDVPQKISWKSVGLPLKRYLPLLSIFFFFLAFSDFHLLSDKTPKESYEQKEGVALYLVLDISGSMKEEIVERTKENTYRAIKKIDLLKEVTKDFVLGSKTYNLQGRSNDLIGLVTFARKPDIQIPLTQDRNSFDKVMNALETVQKKENDGTALGYAIYKTANTIVATEEFAKKNPKIKPPYEIKSVAIIVLTDGFQAPSPLDQGNPLRNTTLEQAALYAKEHAIKVYLVSLDPRISFESFSPQRDRLQQVATLTGGKFFILKEDENLHDIYKEIDQLEKSIIQTPKKETGVWLRTFSFYPLFLSIGLFFLFLYFILQTTILKTFP